MQWREVFFGEGWWKKSTRVHGSLNWSNFHWNLSFIRVVQDGELESLVKFLDVLYTTKVGWEGEDNIIWVLSKHPFYYPFLELESLVKFLEVKTFCKA
jgi:hypothetical protein